MELNRKELKKISHSFNSISSRLMRVQFDEYGMVLKKFVDYIESNEIIMQYICKGNIGEYDAKNEWDLVVTKEGYMFDFGPLWKRKVFRFIVY